MNWVLNDKTSVEGGRYGWLTTEAEVLSTLMLRSGNFIGEMSQRERSRISGTQVVTCSLFTIELVQQKGI